MTFEELSKSDINETLSDMAKDLAGKLGVKLDKKPTAAEVGPSVDLDAIRKIIFQKQNNFRNKNRLSGFDIEDSGLKSLEAKCLEKVKAMAEGYKNAKGKISNQEINSWHTSSKDLGNIILKAYPKGSDKEVVAGNENLGYVEAKNENRSDAIADYVEKMWEKSSAHKQAILLTTPKQHRDSKYKVVSSLAITFENNVYFFAQIMACVVLKAQEDENKSDSESLGKEYGFTETQIKSMFKILFDKNLDESKTLPKVIMFNGRKLYEDFEDLDSDKEDEISVFKKFLSKANENKFQRKIIPLIDEPEGLRNTFKNWAEKQTDLTAHEQKAIKKAFQKIALQKISPVEAPESKETNDSNKSDQENYDSSNKSEQPDYENLTEFQWQQKIYDVLEKIMSSFTTISKISPQISGYINEYLRENGRKNVVAPENLLVGLANAMVGDNKQKTAEIVKNIQDGFVNMGGSKKDSALQTLLILQSKIAAEMKLFCKGGGGSTMVTRAFMDFLEDQMHKRDPLPKQLMQKLRDFVYSEPEKEIPSPED